MSTLVFLAVVAWLLARLGRDRAPSGPETLGTVLADVHRGSRVLVLLHQQRPGRTARWPGLGPDGPSRR